MIPLVRQETDAAVATSGQTKTDLAGASHHAPQHEVIIQGHLPRLAFPVPPPAKLEVFLDFQ